MNTTIQEAENSKLQKSLQQANRLWRRAGVRRPDRKELLSELEAELNGARHDGHHAATVLGEDTLRTLSQWAVERQVAGRALRLGVVIPIALVGIAVGLAVVIVAVVAGFSNRSTIDPGPFVLPLYASAALLAYLCALVGAWVALRRDPHVLSTVRMLATLLPVGAVVSTGAGVAIAWWRNFNTSQTVFVVVITVAVVMLAATVAVARYRAVRAAT